MPQPPSTRGRRWFTRLEPAPRRRSPRPAWWRLLLLPLGAALLAGALAPIDGAPVG